MNNSQLPAEERKDDATRFRERDAVLIHLIDAINQVRATGAWSTLKEEFETEISRLNRLLLTESKKPELNTAEIYRLQGRVEATRKLSLEKLLADYTTERDTIRKKLK